MRVSIYTREKNDAGRWRYERVNTGPGRRPVNLKGPFFLRYTAENGSQPFVPGGETLDEALKAAESLGHALLAKSKGLTVPELDALTDENRKTIKLAIEDFLITKKNKAKRTYDSYNLHLQKFLDQLPHADQGFAPCGPDYAWH